MGGALPPLPQYAFMAWCSVRGSTGHLSVCYVPLRLISHPNVAITNLRINGMYVCMYVCNPRVILLRLLNED
jgi:hypothetical protein